MVSREAFVGGIVDVGLVSAVQLEELQQSIPHDEQPADTLTLARLAVERGLLTEFQADQACQGNAASLVFEEYVILDKLGAGGMGQVFKAQHRRMERVVALKVLPEAATHSPENVKRFRREVKASARLAHPNIVIAHDAGEANERHYLVMEFVVGSDLANRVKTLGPMSVDAAIDCMLQAARGLEHAHSQGIIHRDIKPSNLLLDTAGTVKLLDLGLARIDLPQAAMEVDDGLTSCGDIMGTLDFMSPEQALDSKDADARSDIYSLGCTFYYLLTGHKLYDADTPAKKIVAHRTAPIPPLKQLRCDVPLPVEAAYRKMVEKQPKRRFQTMREVVAALENCQAAQRATAMAPDGRPPTTGRRLLLAIGGAGAVALFLAGLILLLKGSHGEILGESKVPDRTRVQIENGGDPSTSTVAEPSNSPATLTTRQLPPPDASLIELLTSPDYEWTAPESLGPGVNTRSQEDLWGITDDERTLIFDRRSEQSACFTSRRDRIEEAFPAATPLPQLADMTPGTISGDGLIAIGVKQRKTTVAELWQSTRPDLESAWSDAVRMPEPVKGEGVTKHPVLSADGLTLLATSTRQREGISDIWMFTRQSRDEPFSNATRLPEPISTPAWDLPDFVSNDRCLIISSSQRKKMRLTRCFVRTSVNEPFGPGRPLGIPLGASENDDSTAGFRLVAGGRRIYFHSGVLTDHLGSFDLYVSRRVRKSETTTSATEPSR
jgi:serine/threonine protein kinase